jgi:hypothetical protein
MVQTHTVVLQREKKKTKPGLERSRQGQGLNGAARQHPAGPMDILAAAVAANHGHGKVTAQRVPKRIQGESGRLSR